MKFHVRECKKLPIHYRFLSPCLQNYDVDTHAKTQSVCSEQTLDREETIKPQNSLRRKSKRGVTRVVTP